MDPHITDREPTITDIKKRIEQLNKDISKLAAAKNNASTWNIPNMTQATLLKKYNSTNYSSGPKGVARVVNAGWWGSPNPSSAWGKNFFPNDIAWWISIQNYMLLNTMGFFYYIYNSPTAKNIGIYTVIDDICALKVNGQTITRSPTPGDYGGGGAFNVNLKAGKNVFELRLHNGGGPGAFVFYAYDPKNNNKVLFKSGDPGWGVTSNQTYDYNLVTNDSEYLEKSNKKSSENIYRQIKDIQTLIENVSPKVVENNTLKDTNATTLLAKLDQAQATYAALVEEIKIPDYYTASNEAANIKTNSNFNHYVLYLIFTILFLIGLLFVLKNPEAGNLDTMMLILGIGIILYHGYEYYMKKQRTK